MFVFSGIKELDVSNCTYFHQENEAPKKKLEATKESKTECCNMSRIFSCVLHFLKLANVFIIFDCVCFFKNSFNFQFYFTKFNIRLEECEQTWCFYLQLLPSRKWITKKKRKKLEVKKESRKEKRIKAEPGISANVLTSSP